MFLRTTKLQALPHGAFGGLSLTTRTQLCDMQHLIGPTYLLACFLHSHRAEL